MQKPNYYDDYHKKLCKQKDPISNKTLLQLQFDRIGEFIEAIRTTHIAKTYSKIYNKAFKPCNL